MPHASTSLQCIWLVAVAFWSEKDGRTAMTYFCPALDLPLGGYGRNTLTNVRAMSIPTKFHKHPSSDSVVKAMTMCSHTYTCISTPPFLRLDKYIKNSLKFLKHLNLLYRQSSTYKHSYLTK